MNKRQEDKLSMYQAVDAVLTANETLWSGRPAYVAARSEFGTVVGRIESLIEEQETATVGATTRKQALRVALADQALPVSGALVAYATVIDDDELAAQADVSYSDFVHERDTRALTDGQRLLGLATTHVAALPDYGIDAAALTKFGQAVEAYADAVQRPRTVIAERAAATDQLAPAFSEADKILKKRLDPLTVVFRSSAPAFFLAYESARIIVDSGGPGEKEDPETPQPPTP